MNATTRHHIVISLITLLIAVVVTACSVASKSAPPEHADILRTQVPEADPDAGLRYVAADRSANLDINLDPDPPASTPPAACSADDLSFARTNGNAAMGTGGESIELTNISGTNCTLPRGDISVRMLTDGIDQELVIVRDSSQLSEDTAPTPPADDTDGNTNAGVMTVLAPSEQVFVDLVWHISQSPTDGEQVIELHMPVIGTVELPAKPEDPQFIGIDRNGRLMVSPTWRTTDGHDATQDWTGSNADLDTRTADDIDYCPIESLRYRTDTSPSNSAVRMVGTTVVNYGNDMCKLGRVVALSSTSDPEQPAIRLIIQGDAHPLPDSTADIRISPGNGIRYAALCDDSTEQWIANHRTAIVQAPIPLFPVDDLRACAAT